MTDASPDQDLLRALELADGYLTEAETVLWKTASNVDADERREPVEELTQDLWEIQHQIQELQEEFENSSSH